MSIESGISAPAELAFAAVAASTLYLGQLPQLFKSPALVLRIGLAAIFFALIVQAFPMHVGPAELHFIGAMPIYPTFGFIPILFGFAIGLLRQGALFEPQDLVHWAVNSLSLAVPLIVLLYSFGRKISQVNVATIMKLDAYYYCGVTLLAGFWLFITNQATPLVEWLHFSSSYLILVAMQPVSMMAIFLFIQRYYHTNLANKYCVNSSMRLKTAGSV